jgi:hypothetical protein
MGASISFLLQIVYSYKYENKIFIYSYLPRKAAIYAGITYFNFSDTERNSFIKKVVLSVPINVYMVHVEWL